MAQGSRLDRWRSGGGEGNEPPEDPPAQFQQRLEQEQEPEAPFDFEEPSSARQYRAFNTQRGVPSIELRRVLGAWHAPFYPFLLNVSRNANYGDNFVLFFSSMQVEVEGENLQPVIKAIREKRCAYIQDFHSEEHDAPAKGEPIIRKIDVITKDHADAMAEVDKRYTEKVQDARRRP